MTYDYFRFYYNENVLYFRVVRKVGHLQWTKDGFGLGTDRDLHGFSRYQMIGSDDEGNFI